MSELNEKDTAKLVSLIYGTTINDDWGELKKLNSNKMRDMVSIMEADVSKLKSDE